MRTRIKICGLTCSEDALFAVSCGADALGFIFVEESPRRVYPDQAAGITARIPPFVTQVGVFKNHDQDWIRKVFHECGLHLCQLHGDESPAYCRELKLPYIKAFRIKDESSLAPIPLYGHTTGESAFLLDTFVPEKAGGTGLHFDWQIAKLASRFGPVILSGGLTPENVGEAIKLAMPFAVDVGSGVEKEPGKKSFEKVRSFINRIKQIDFEIYNTT